jgi:hypothetical protein
MHCDKVQELFSELHEETLAAGLRQAVQSHLDDCYECRADYEGFVSLFGALGSLPKVDPPATLTEEVSRRLDHAIWEAKQKSKPGLGWLRLSIGGIAAAVVIGVAYVSIDRFQTDGIEAGYGVPVSKAEFEFKMKDGNPVLILNPKSDTAVRITENGVVLVDEVVRPSSSREYQLNRKGERPATVWIQVGDRKPKVAIVPSGTSNAGAGAFEGTLVDGLEAISEGFGYVIVATVADDSRTLQVDFTGQNLNDALRSLLEGTGYKFRATNGLIEVD